MYNHKFLSKAAVLGCLISGALFAQAPAAAPLAFEVATIKLSEPLMQMVQAGKMPKVGLTVEGTRVEIGASSLSELLAMAYEVKSFQISGPEWLNASPMTVDRFNIQAKVAAGTTKEQVPQMLRGLLTERFGLKMHKASKDQDVYALTVAKTGLKMKETVEETPAPASGLTVNGTGNNMRQTANGMEIDSGANGKMSMTMDADRKMHMKASKMTVTQMVETVARFVDRPIVDQTELKGNYEMELVMSMDDILKVSRAMGVPIPGQPSDPLKPAEAASDPGSSSIFTSVQQLGLKLEPKKAPLELIVVDSLAKAPTDN